MDDQNACIEDIKDAMAEADPVRGYLQSVVGACRGMNANTDHPYCCVEDFVLRHGVRFTPQPLPADCPRGPMKNCYQNALEAANVRPDLAYCEGYATVGWFPVLHAFLCDSEGNCYDPTWDDGVEYVGVPIKRGYLLRTVVETGTYGVLDKPENRFAILRGQHDVQDVIDTRYTQISQNIISDHP